MLALTYGASKTAKSGRRVPAFLDGKAMYSLYAPERDARVFQDQLGQETGFVVMAGVGDGSHIAALLERCPDARVLALEHSEENLRFLLKEFDLASLTRNPQVVFFAFDKSANLTAAILQQYIPHLHGGFALCFQEAWKRCHEADAKGIVCAVEAALERIKGDMATQASFGKLWMRNILLNSRLNLREREDALSAENDACIIVAAGPTMEEHLDELRGAKTMGVSLLSVDTAYPALLRRGIVPDGVVTIDRQAVSAAHFLGCGNKAPPALRCPFSLLIYAAILPSRAFPPAKGKQYAFSSAITPSAFWRTASFPIYCRKSKLKAVPSPWLPWIWRYN